MKNNHWFTKLLSIAIRIVLTIFIITGLFILITTLYHYFSNEPSSRFYKGIDKNVGTMTEIIAIGAGLLWLIRIVWLELKKRKIKLADFIQKLFLTLKNFHVTFGVITLILAFSHGLYFLLNPVDEKFQFYSGIVTFLSLILLALLGWNYKNRQKTKKGMVAKRRHMAFAVVFGILALIHIYL